MCFRYYLKIYIFFLECAPIRIDHGVSRDKKTREMIPNIQRPQPSLGITGKQGE